VSDPQPRQVTAALAWRVAQNTLGRMACETGAPNDGHDHGACVVDDESYAADLMLRITAAAAAGDETRALDRLTDLLSAIREPLKQA
jgi:hypothetical protein